MRLETLMLSKLSYIHKLKYHMVFIIQKTQYINKVQDKRQIRVKKVRKKHIVIHHGLLLKLYLDFAQLSYMLYTVFGLFVYLLIYVYDN